MFRKIITYSVLVVFCFQFMFCRTDDTETETNDVLNVTPTEMTFSANEGEKPFRVDSRLRIPWQIDSTLSAEWLHVRTNDKNEMFVVVDKNLSGVKRSSIVEVTTVNHKYQKVITVVQVTKDASLVETSKDTVTLYTNRYPIQFTVTADGEWHFDLLPDWISIQRVDSVDDKTAVEVVQQSLNASSDMRSQLILVSFGLDTKPILIQQWGNIDAHIYSEGQQLQSILSQDGLFHTIEMLTLEGGVDYSDFEVLHRIEKLRVLDLKNIDISDGQTNLPAFALKANPSLEEVTMPKGTTTLSHGLFMDCSMLHKVNLSDKVTVIEELVFAGCRSLVSLRLPKSLTNINAEAFKGCFVKELILESETPPKLGETVFDETTFETCILTVPKGSIEAYKAERDWMRFLNMKEAD